MSSTLGTIINDSIDALIHSTDGFGLTATYTPVGGDASAITVVYGSNQEFDLREAADAFGQTQNFYILVEDVTTVAQNDTILVEGTTYKVLYAELDELRIRWFVKAGKVS